MINIKKVDYSC